MNVMGNQWRMGRKSISDKDRPAICIRTREAREFAGYKKRQKEFAKALGMEAGAYNKYEIRSPIKTEHIAKFLELTKVSPEWFLHGRGEMAGTDPLQAALKIFRLPASREKIDRVFKELQDAERAILGDEEK